MARYKLSTGVLELIKLGEPSSTIWQEIIEMHRSHKTVIRRLNGAVVDMPYSVEMEFIACFAALYGHLKLLHAVLANRSTDTASDTWVFNPLVTAITRNPEDEIVETLVEWKVPSSPVYNGYRGRIINDVMLRRRTYPMYLAIENDELELMLKIMPTYYFGHGSFHVMQLALYLRADSCQRYIVDNSVTHEGFRVLGNSVPIRVSPYGHNVSIPNGCDLTALTNLADEPFYMQLNMPCVCYGKRKDKPYLELLTETCSKIRCRNLQQNSQLPVVEWDTFNRLQLWLCIYGRRRYHTDVRGPLHVASRMCDAFLLHGVQHHVMAGNVVRSLIDSFLKVCPSCPTPEALHYTVEHIRSLLVHGSLITPASYRCIDSMYCWSLNTRLSPAQKVKCVEIAEICANLMPHRGYESFRVHYRTNIPLSSPRRLQELSRVAVYSNICDGRMAVYAHRLPLPKKLKSYLLLE